MRDVLSWSFPVGQLFGILIRVHLIMPLFIIGMIGREAMRKEAEPGSWMDASIIMAMIFFCVLLHEFGHCFAARYMDGEADEVLLWPLGGLAFCRALPHKPSAHFVVAMGGPLVNLILCVITSLVLSLALDQNYQPQFNPIWYPYRWQASGGMELNLWNGQAVMTHNLVAINLQRFWWVNWVQLLFNILIIGIPLDGGRMLQATLWPRFGHYQATKVAIYSGFFFMVLAVLASIVFRESLLILLAVFIFTSCAQELMMLEAEREDSLFGYDFSQGYTSLEKDKAPPAPEPKKQNFIQRWLAERAAKKEQEEREEREAEDKRMDELLEKIQKYGKDSLTDEEQRFLRRVSDRYKNK